MEETRVAHPVNYAMFMQGVSKATVAFQEYLRMHIFPHTIAPAATRRWARKVFPGDADQLERLWSLLFRFSAADRSNFEEVLEERKQAQQARVERLDRLAIREIRVEGGGNALTLKIPNPARWIGAFAQTSTRQSYSPNFPSGEIFTVPDRRSAVGTLVASMPFRLLNLALVKDLVLKFRDGGC